MLKSVTALVTTFSFELEIHCATPEDKIPVVELGYIQYYSFIRFLARLPSPTRSQGYKFYNFYAVEVCVSLPFDPEFIVNGKYVCYKTEPTVCFKAKFTQNRYCG